MDRFVTIELFGQPYTFLAETEMDQARTVADVLIREVEKEKVKQSDQQPARLSKLAILISVALNIANENYEMKAKNAETMEELNVRAKRLIHSLDACLQ
ncbi:MAG: cell division protein ZapA [Desulfobacterales bacterium]|nr:cell division protein ZapA [Desulfobacterales bacterium]